MCMIATFVTVCGHSCDQDLAPIAALQCGTCSLLSPYQSLSHNLHRASPSNYSWLMQISIRLSACLPQSRSAGLDMPLVAEDCKYWQPQKPKDKFCQTTASPGICNHHSITPSLHAGEPASPSSTALVIADLPAKPASSQPEAHGFDVSATSGCLVDAGLMLGQSCRVGWSPKGTLVIPGMLAVVTECID